MLTCWYYSPLHIITLVMKPLGDAAKLMKWTSQQPSTSHHGPVLCKALHLAPRRLTKILLQFDARVNVVDCQGRTPLDFSAPGFSFMIDAEEEYAHAATLIRHGAQLSGKGADSFPGFLFMLRELVPGIMFSDEFKKPGVLHWHHSKAVQLVKKIKGSRMRRRRKGSAFWE